MWFYPIPTIIALIGWFFLLFTDSKHWTTCAAVLALGCVAFVGWRGWASLARAQA
jgi:hypothetical protein